MTKTRNLPKKNKVAADSINRAVVDIANDLMSILDYRARKIFDAQESSERREIAVRLVKLRIVNLIFMMFYMPIIDAVKRSEKVEK